MTARWLDVVTFNAVGAMPTDRRHLGRECLREAKKHGQLLNGVECDDLTREDLHEILGPDWWWRHRPRQELLDGTLVAGLRARTTPYAARWLPGAPASRVNAARDFLRVRVGVDAGTPDAWSFTDAVLHLPRPDHGGEYAHRLMRGRSHSIGADLLEGDFNIGAAAMADTYPDRTIRSAGVIHSAAVPRLELGPAKPYDQVPGTTADDHRGLAKRVRPHPKETR
jgi:hypothetical protein